MVFILSLYYTSGTLYSPLRTSITEFTGGCGLFRPLQTPQGQVLMVFDSVLFIFYPYGK